MISEPFCYLASYRQWRRYLLVLFVMWSAAHAIRRSISALPRLENGAMQIRKEQDICSENHCEIVSYSLIRGWCVLVGMVLDCILFGFYMKFKSKKKKKKPVELDVNALLQQQQQQQQQQQNLLQLKQQLNQSPQKSSASKWSKKLLLVFILLGIVVSIWLFWHLNKNLMLWRKETLVNMCEQRARMLQDQFNVSMNHVHSLAILISTFHHEKSPSAIDQKTFEKYTERTSFERPLTSGVAYALKVVHSEREQFEKQHGWAIKKMEIEDQSLVQDCTPEKLEPSPPRDEYAPVIFSQETVSHIVSIDMMSGRDDRENILRARASGKGVLTSPFKLLKSNHLGVVLTFAVYKPDLPPDASPEERTESAVGYLGASYDVPSLVEKLLRQLASKQKIVVHVYDTTNASSPILMYGNNVGDTDLLHFSQLDFGDPRRKHEMHCWFEHKAPLPWIAISTSVGVAVITLLVGQIFHAAINRISEVEEAYLQMMKLKVRAEAADVAKSQFLAIVSHEIRTPMNGVLGMLQMLMDTELDASQMDYAQTAHASGEDLISLINDVLDQAKIESGRLELEAVPFDLRSVLDNVLSLFSGKSIDKGIELAVYVSNQVPDVVVGDPGRFRQIITNLVGNCVKFTHDKGHIFVTVHLADEIAHLHEHTDPVLKHSSSSTKHNTLSGFPVVDKWKSWENFKHCNSSSAMADPEIIKLLVMVEDTGVGIPIDAQSRIFTPFMQADSSTSRTYGGTGIGLSISRRMVELMGGEIVFLSEPGTGSTFSFTSCFRRTEISRLGIPWRQQQQQHTCEQALLQFQGRKALVIDERSIRAEVTRYYIERLGISVTTASTMAAASSLLSSSSTAADLQMVIIEKEAWDRETAIVLHSLLSGEGRGRPRVLLLENTISIEEVQDLRSTGLIDHVLMKPLRLNSLISCFQELQIFDNKRQPGNKMLSSLQNLIRGKQILVVDDNLVNRKVAECILKIYGVIVTCVGSGKAALSMLNPPHHFDACFMDRHMPEMDGFEATRQIRAMEEEHNKKTDCNGGNWHTPILAMTADVTELISEECRKCGMDYYISKPFDANQLYDAVARFFPSSHVD